MRARRAGESALLLVDVVDVLAIEGIEHAVIGALAASVYGAVRASMDADAVLSLSAREAGDVPRLLVAAGFQVKVNRGDFDDPIAVFARERDAPFHGGARTSRVMWLER